MTVWGSLIRWHTQNIDQKLLFFMMLTDDVDLEITEIFFDLLFT